LCTAPEWDLVEAYLMWAEPQEAYRLAVLEFHKKFGIKHVVVSAWVDRFTSGNRPDPTRYCRELKICYSALRQQGYLSEIATDWHITRLL